MTSAVYARDYNETKELGGVKSARRTAQQTEAVKFWSQPNLTTAWYESARQLGAAKRLDLADNARLYALLSMAAANSYITDWDAKFQYNRWRPVTAIRNGDLDGNDATERDPGWTSLNATPMHPEYPSQAAILASVAAGVFEAVLGPGPGPALVVSDRRRRQAQPAVRQLRGDGRGDAPGADLERHPLSQRARSERHDGAPDRELRRRELASAGALIVPDGRSHATIWPMTATATPRAAATQKAKAVATASPSLLAPARQRARHPADPRRRPDADAHARLPADRAAARDGPVLAVPDRGDLGLRRARPGLVLEQLLLRRAHRNPLRRADPLDLGPDLANNSVDTIPAEHFVAPACVIDCSAEAAADPDYLLTVADIERFEAEHGRIPEGAWLLMRTDWSKKKDPEAYQNFDETGQHTPGPSAEAVQFLVEQRNVLGFGSEAIGTDAGQGYHLRPPYPCHYTMHGAGRYGLQCLANLDLLPPTGAVLICPPLKIEKGSGSPLRVLALVEELA